MKTLSQNFSLLRLYVQSMPRNVLFITAMAIGSILLMNNIAPRDAGRDIGLATNSTGLFQLYFSLFAGAMMLIGAPVHSPQEFILTRPVSRRRSYFILLVIFFTIVLTPMLIKVSLSYQQPTLTYSYYEHDGGPDTTKSKQQVNTYRILFSDTKIEQSGDQHTLIISKGNLILAGVMLSTTIFFAILMQLFYFAPFVEKVKKSVIMSLAVAPILPSFFLLVTLHAKVSPMENAFLFFVRHWQSLTIFIVLAIIAVQIFSWKQSREIEIL